MTENEKNLGRNIMETQARLESFCDILTSTLRRDVAIADCETTAMIQVFFILSN